MWPFFQQNCQFGAIFNYRQWTSEKCLSEESLSNPRNSLWQAGLFRYQVHEWTKILQKLSNLRLWIDLCPKGDLQRHKYNNLDRETCAGICIHFFKPFERTNCHWDIEPTVIKKANQFISFKFGDNQLLDIMNVLGGATSPHSFVKAYKVSVRKGFFPYKWFDHPVKMQNTELPPYDVFTENFVAVTLLKPNTRTMII